MFSENAPKYWAKNVPVIPLRPRQKIPAVMHWSVFGSSMPSDDEQERWLEAFPDGNIGLPLGPQSGVVAIDLDSEDPRVLEVLLRLMPKQLWKRVGKKGAVFAFKYNGEPARKIHGEEGMLFEILSKGNQVVLPPSIHPDTQMPYTANCELLDVIDQLPTLPMDFETNAREMLIAAGVKLAPRGSTKITDWVPAGGRDSTMVSVAGLHAQAVLRGERTLQEALAQMETWVQTFTERVAGDLLDPEKARQKLMEFVRRDIIERKKILPPNWSVGLSPEDKAECQRYFGDDIEETTLDELLTFLAARFTEIPVDAVSDRRAVVEEALLRISKSPSMGSLDVESALTMIRSSSGGMVAITALRKRLKELQTTGIKGEHHTEIAEALLKELEDEREGDVRYQNDTFYRWAGSHWDVLDEAHILSVLAREFGGLPAAKRNSDHKGILAVMSRLCSKALRTDHIAGINLANGFLTTDLQLLDHDPRFGATSVMPYRYVPDERFPSMFMSLLDQAWGGDEDYLEKVQALREAMAVTMFGLATQFSRSICLYGMPHSGKSVIMEIMRGMVPSNACSNISPHDWGDKFLATELCGSLINFCGEISETQTIEGDRFKMIVEGAEMNGQHKGRDIFKFRPQCAHWFASNHLPRTRDTSGGFIRRWLFLVFNRSCPEDQKRIGYHMEILAEEREAIAAWVIPAITDILRQQEYTQPVSHRQQLAEIANLNNTARHYLKTGGVLFDPALRVKEEDLYRSYLTFVRMVAHAQPMAMSRFRTVLRALQSELHFTVITAADERGVDVTTYFGMGLAVPKIGRLL